MKNKLRYLIYCILGVALLYALAPVLHLIIIFAGISIFFGYLADWEKEVDFFHGLMVIAIFAGFIVTFIYYVDYYLISNHQLWPQFVKLNKPVSDVLVYLFRWKLIF